MAGASSSPAERLRAMREDVTGAVHHYVEPRADMLNHRAEGWLSQFLTLIPLFMSWAGPAFDRARPQMRQMAHAVTDRFEPPERTSSLKPILMTAALFGIAVLLYRTAKQDH